MRRKSTAFVVRTGKPWRIAVAPMTRSRAPSVTPRPSALTRCAWTRATSRSKGSGRNNLKTASTNAERRARRCSVLARCTPTRSSEQVAADMKPSPYAGLYLEKSTAAGSLSIRINTPVSMINPDATASGRILANPRSMSSANSSASAGPGGAASAGARRADRGRHPPAPLPARAAQPLPCRVRYRTRRPDSAPGSGPPRTACRVRCGDFSRHHDAPMSIDIRLSDNHLIPNDCLGARGWPPLARTPNGVLQGEEVFVACAADCAQRDRAIERDESPVVANWQARAGRGRSVGAGRGSGLRRRRAHRARSHRRARTRGGCSPWLHATARFRLARRPDSGSGGAT